MTITQIQQLVCEAYGVSLCELLSARRNRGIIEPRWVAMWLARETTWHSLPAIGREFGGRDHTTIIHALKQIDARRDADARFGEKMDALRRAVNRGNSADFRRASMRVAA